MRGRAYNPSVKNFTDDARFVQLDTQITNWMARHAVRLLRLSLGIIFLWFGVLKFFPGVSPADELATRTISVLSFGLVEPHVSRPVLAAWETAIGLGLISGVWLRGVIALLALQMLGTVTPLVLFPEQTWRVIPIVPTLEGQYIIKNMVLVSAALVIGATLRGGAVIADPEAAKQASRLADQPLDPQRN